MWFYLYNISILLCDNNQNLQHGLSPHGHMKASPNHSVWSLGNFGDCLEFYYHFSSVEMKLKIVKNVSWQAVANWSFSIWYWFVLVTYETVSLLHNILNSAHSMCSCHDFIAWKLGTCAVVNKYILSFPNNPTWGVSFEQVF